jgi:ubiquitin-activating enzyme E1 C
VYIDNYMMYTGDAGVYTYTFALSQSPDCPVCGTARSKLVLAKGATVQGLIDVLAEVPFSLKKPSLRVEGKSVYMQAPPVLEQKTRVNLGMGVDVFVGGGGEVIVTDGALPICLTLDISFRE